MSTTAPPRQVPTALPEGLETMPPGPELAVLLGGVDPSRLTGHDAVIYLQARHRQLAHDEAMELDALMQVGLAVSAETTERGEEPGTFAAEEIKCALGWSSVKARNRLKYAMDVRNRLPDVVNAQRQGRIDGTTTWAFADNVLNLADEHIAVIVERLLPIAPTITTGDLIRRIRRLAADLDKDWLEKRYKASVTGRHVRAWVTKDGSGGIGGYDLPIDKVAAAERRLQNLAKRAKRAGDGRKMDALRADLMLLLLGAETDGMSDDDIVAWLVANPEDPADLPTKVQEQDAWVPDNDSDDGDVGEPPDGGGGPDGPDGDGGAPGGDAKAPEPTDEHDDADGDRDGGVVFDGHHPDAPADDDGGDERSPEPAPSWWGPGELRVRLTTLTLWDQRCGELAGKGHVPPVLARRLALAATGPSGAGSSSTMSVHVPL